MKAFIYKIINLENNKFYIGSTIRPQHIRKYEHFSELRSGKHCNKHLQRSFDKYGEKNFEFEIFENLQFPDSYTKEYVREYTAAREGYYMTLLVPDYNMRIETDCRIGYTHSAETKAKISASNKGKCTGRKLSKEHIEKIVKANTGQKRGPMHTDETKRKISEAHKGKKLSEETKKKMSERCKGAKNIELITRARIASIEARKGIPRSFQTKLRGVEKKYGKRIIEIYDLNQNLLHTCNFSYEASNLTGVSRTAIGNNLSGRSMKTKNFIFKYKNL